MEDMEVFIKRIFTGERKDDSLSKKRMLALLCLLFFGVRRFDDVQRIKVKDVTVVGEDKVEIKLGRTKTDQTAKGVDGQDFRSNSRRHFCCKDSEVGHYKGWFEERGFPFL